MTPEETRCFEQGSHYESALQLRRYDDAGKDPTVPERSIEHFRLVLEAALSSDGTA